MAIFERLGYRVTLSFEKRRETWELDGCTVELDELPAGINGGTFAEVEGPTEDAVRQVVEKLGLAGEAQLKQSYSEMIANHLDAKGGERVVRFM